MAKSSARQNPVVPRPRRSRRLLAWALVLAIAALAWFWTPLSRLAHAGSAYGAHVACGCHFIAGRDLKQCSADLMPGMEPVTLSADPEGKTVTARYLLMFAETARYSEAEGCVLEKWER